MPSQRVLPVIVYRVFLDWVAAFKFLVEGGFRDFLMVYKAHIDFYKRLPSLRKKRTGKRLGKVSCMYMRNIVFDCMVMRKGKFSELKEDCFSK